MPKTKGTPHATNTVGATNKEARKSTTRRAQDAKRTAGSSVHNSAKTVQPRAKTANRAADKPRSRAKVTRTTRQPRTKTTVQRPKKQVIVHSYPDDSTLDMIVIATGILVLLAVGFTVAKVLS